MRSNNYPFQDLPHVSVTHLSALQSPQLQEPVPQLRVWPASFIDNHSSSTLELSTRTIAGFFGKEFARKQPATTFNTVKDSSPTSLAQFPCSAMQLGSQETPTWICQRSKIPKPLVPWIVCSTLSIGAWAVASCCNGGPWATSLRPSNRVCFDTNT